MNKKNDKNKINIVDAKFSKTSSISSSQKKHVDKALETAMGLIIDLKNEKGQK